MFCRNEPPADSVNHFLKQRSDAAVTYSPLCETQFPTRVKGYMNDLTECHIGRGEECWEKAREAVQGWKIFPATWANVHCDRPGQGVGTVVGVVLKHLGFYSINPSRIVYTVDEDRQYGFAYGTLPGHAERGEEQFMVKWDRATDLVSYRIKSFSRPHHLLAWLGFPIVRMLQHRFVRDSIAQMKGLCGSNETPPPPISS